MCHSNQSIYLQKPPTDVLSNMCLVTLKHPKRFVWQSSNLKINTFQKFTAFSVLIGSVLNSDGSRTIFILVYWLGLPNSGTKKMKYTFIYTIILHCRLCFFLFNLSKAFLSKKTDFLRYKPSC